MTDAEEKELRDWSTQIAGAEQQPWQPLLVSNAFSSRREFPALTMQGWIDLDAARSPFLHGEWPEDADGIAGALADAARALKMPDGKWQSAWEAARLTLDVRRAVNEAFSTVLRMRPPGEAAPDRGDDGLGNWLPVLACLISQLRMSESAALGLPVARAFALIAGHRFNEGWTVTGENYRLREVAESHASEPSEDGAAAAANNPPTTGRTTARPERSQTEPLQAESEA
jgi:hypothetical protein